METFKPDCLFYETIGKWLSTTEILTVAQTLAWSFIPHIDISSNFYLMGYSYDLRKPSQSSSLVLAINSSKPQRYRIAIIGDGGHFVALLCDIAKHTVDDKIKYVIFDSFDSSDVADSTRAFMLEQNAEEIKVINFIKI